MVCSAEQNFSDLIGNLIGKIQSYNTQRVVTASTIKEIDIHLDIVKRRF